MEELTFKKGKGYKYSTIEKFVDSTHGEATIEEHGHNEIGKGFLIIEYEGQSASFMLSAASSTSYLYETIWSDL